MAVVKYSYISVMLYRSFLWYSGVQNGSCPRVGGERFNEQKNIAPPVFRAYGTGVAVSLLTGCGTKTAENVEKQEDAQTIQVYLWTNNLYETYAPYISPSCRM